MPTLQDVKTWSGQEAVGPDGEKVGKVDHLYLDSQSGEPTFAAVKTGLFGSNVSLVPIQDAKTQDGHVHLGYDKATIKDAPNIEADAELSGAEEAELYAYYGISGYSQHEGDDHADVTDDAMARSKEELRVGTRQEQVGKARLRKYTVTDEVQVDESVRKEQIDTHGDVDAMRR